MFQVQKTYTKGVQYTRNRQSLKARNLMSLRARKLSSRRPHDKPRTHNECSRIISFLVNIKVIAARRTEFIPLLPIRPAISYNDFRVRFSDVRMTHLSMI